MARQRIRVTEHTPKEAAFLAAYEKCLSIRGAARAAKWDPKEHYVSLRKPSYAEQFELAHMRGITILEDEARRRAVQGVKRKVRHLGKVVGDEVVYSDRLLEVLLKGEFSKKYRENVAMDVSGSVNVVELINAGRARAAKRKAEAGQ